MKMLIVDDMETNSAIMKRMAMRVFSGTIDTVTSPDLAIMACLRNCYDIIITDYMMPGIDGISLVKKIRSLQSYKDVPVIMASASPSQWLSIVARENGINDFVPKPINMRHFRQLILKHIEGATDSQNIALEQPPA